MRREDLIGRIGGDEFALLVRVPSIAEGQGIARDIHARLSAVLAQSRYPVTCSMGALLIPPEVPRTISELIHAADPAMYRAKRGGKTAVEIDDSTDPQGAATLPIALQRREGFESSISPSSAGMKKPNGFRVKAGCGLTTRALTKRQAGPVSASDTTRWRWRGG